MRRPLAALALVALLTTAGCGFGPPADPTATTATTTTATTTADATTTAATATTRSDDSSASVRTGGFTDAPPSGRAAVPDDLASLPGLYRRHYRAVGSGSVRFDATITAVRNGSTIASVTGRSAASRCGRPTARARRRAPTSSTGGTLSATSPSTASPVPERYRDARKSLQDRPQEAVRSTWKTLPNIPIGKAIAERFAAEGAAVVVNSRSAERAEAAAEDLRERGAEAVGVAADVSEYDEVAALVDAAVERFGRLDVMVNNAGITTIAVNALAPGFVRTGITDQTQDAAGYTDEDVRKRTPMARFGTLEEMAECAAFLVSRDNYVTGEVLEADGGWTADAWRYWPDRGE